MTNPITYRYIGQFADSNYGTDEVGELFESIEDAKRKLNSRLGLGYWANQPFVRPDGQVEEVKLPAVTGEACIYLHDIVWINEEELAEYRTRDESRKPYGYAPRSLPSGVCQVFVYLSRKYNARSRRVE